MEPIISPWLIYLLGFIDGLNCFFGVLGGVGITVSLVILISGLVTKESYRSYGKDDDDFIRGEMLTLLGKRIFFPSLLFIMLCIVIPSRNTIIGMIAAKNITRDNISAVIDAGKSVKDEVKSDLADIIRMIANGGEEEKDKE